jgi:GNAT superfamily N-acetyltransferase
VTITTEFDTLTDRAARSMADRIVHHATAVGRPLHDDDGLVVGWLGDRGMFINCGVVLSPPADWNDLLAVVGEVVPPGSPATLISAYATPDLAERGWTLIGHPPLMARLSGAAPAPAIPAELRIHEVVDQPGLEAFERTLVDGYPMPDMQPYQWGGFYDERVLGGPTRFWLGFVDGHPVATGAAHVSAGVNNVEMIATLEEFRGHGYGAAVTWAATTADPSLPAILLASDPGRPVYERLGYTALTRWTMWLRP